MTASREALERRIAELREHPVRPGAPGQNPRGRLLVIGGHEDKEDGRVILRRLAKLVGDGKLVVATLASESPSAMWETYEPTLRALGVRHLHHLRVERREDAHEVRALRVLEDATAVFFTGGDQLRITAQVGDTPVFSRIVEIYLAGGIIAGTSAGASVLSETMLVGGGAEQSHRIGDALQLAPGFGFARDMVIDQHFAERGRIGRLLAVVAQNPRILGVGIDENTAIEVSRGRHLSVLGGGGVTIIDGSRIAYTNVAEADRRRTLTVIDARVHLLSQGDRFDLSTREASSHPAEAIDDELGVDAAADD
ncbi:MAG TPA: cyanophycinase [Gemmatimonadaceae bacterium]|nr:cyanophycinase [Gemmatimonadaceae bacterium]